MIHFTPPRVFGSPPLNEIGVGFDPEYGQEQMSLAGYPNCEGFPKITIAGFTEVESWANHLFTNTSIWLGCDTNDWEIDYHPYCCIGFIEPPEPPTLEQQPHIFVLGWSDDYPDSHAWLYERRYCQNIITISVIAWIHDVEMPRSCTHIDTLLEKAARENNQVRRSELYRQVEEGFFGEEGEFPIAPLYMRANYQLVKTWYTGPFETDLYSGQHWDAYTIDMTAKLAARNGN